MSGSFVPVRPAEVSSGVVDGDVVVYHLRTGRLVRLDRVGSVVWQSIDGSASLDELAADLAAGFSADPAVVRADVGELADALLQAGLLADAVDAVAADPFDAGGPAPTSEADPLVLTDPPSP